MTPLSPQVVIDPLLGTIRVRFAGGDIDDPGLRRRFMARAFACSHVTQVEFQPRSSEAEIHVDAPRERLGDVLRELGRALVGNRCMVVPDDACSRLPVAVHRVGGRLTTWCVTAVRADRLRFSHPRLRRDRTLARRVHRMAPTIRGVRAARLTGWSSDLVVDVDPAAFDGDSLLARLQEEVDKGPRGRVTSAWEMAGTTATLGVAAATDLAVSALAPLSAVLLVGSNLRTLKAAAADLRQRRIGMPAVTTAIVIGTLATGQFLASGIMAWSFDFWRRRHRRDVEAERQLLIEEAVPLPATSQVVDAAPMTESPILREGPLPLEPGDVVPADGRVVVGSGVIDDRSVSGVPGARSVAEGAAIPAGAVVLGGRLSMQVEKPLPETRLAMIGRMLEEATRWRPGRHAPTLQAEAFGEKFAVPTLATAGLGLLAGDLTTAVAVMRPDYSNGEAIAGSFEDLEAVGRGLAAGAVIRSPRALDALARIDTLVLLPSRDLTCGRLEVARIVRDMTDGKTTTMDERKRGERASHTEAIRWAASLAMHVADERREALTGLAAAQGIALISVVPESFGDGEGIRILARAGKREIVIHEAVPEKDGFRPLVFEVDGRPVATFEFSRSAELRGAAVIDLLRREHGIATLLMVPPEDTDAADLAAALRCDGTLSTGDGGIKAALEPLIRDGRRIACAGTGGGLVGIGRPVVTIDLGGGAGVTTADIFILAGDLGRIPDLVAAGRERMRRVATVRRFTILPNALCVAGAFFLGFTSLVAAVVCNLTTFGTYRRSLHALTDKARPANTRYAVPRVGRRL